MSGSKDFKTLAVPSEEGMLTTHRLIILSVSLAAFMGSLDVTIVNISLPTISKYFDVSTSTVSWVVIVYLLVLGSFMLTFGKLGDLKGFKKIFISGFIVFTIGSLLCGLSWNIGTLIAFRMIQATGASMTASIGPAMVSSFLPSEIRGKALGYVTTFASLGIAAGPVIGGILTTYLSWRWIFFVNLPVGVGAVLIGMAVLPGGRARAADASFDLLGSVLAFTSLAALVFSLNMGQEIGWSSYPIIGTFIVSLALVSAFVFNEKRHSEPILDLSLLGQKGFAIANVAALLIMFLFTGAIFLFPFYLELLRGLGPDMAGIFLMVPPLCMMLIGPVAGRFSDHYGSRGICCIAACLCTLGFSMFGSLTDTTGYPFTIIALGLMGLSVGLFIAPSSRLIMGYSPPNEEGMASSLMMTMRNIGALIGVAAFETIFAETIHGSKAGFSGAAFSEMSSAILVKGFHNAFVFGVVVGIITLVLSCLAKDRISLGK